LLVFEKKLLIADQVRNDGASKPVMVGRTEKHLNQSVQWRRRCVYAKI